MKQNTVLRLLAAALCALATPGIAPADPLAYVPITSAARVQLIDTRNGNTVAHIPTAAAPIGIVIDAPRGQLYLAHQNFPNGSITRIDMATRQVSGQLVLPTDAWGIGLSPDGTRAYVALSGLDQLGIVDTASLSMISTVATGATPRNIVVSADGTRVYVSNQSSSTLSVLDAVTQTLIGTYPLCTAPLGLALRPGDSTLYAVCFFDSSLVRFDTSSLSVSGSTPTGSGPSGVAVSADASRIYVAATSDDSVTVIDGSSHAFLARIPVGDGPYGLSISSDNSRVYVSNVHSETLSVIDTASNTVLDTYPLTDSAFAVGHFLAPARVPDAPIIGTPAAGNGSASINFAVPAFDGGSSISGYTASCGTATQTGMPPAINVTGLVNGTTYSCRVHASNSVGDSLPSASVSVTPATVPGAPMLLSATAGAGQATLQFNAPSNDGGSAISSYTATCDPGAITASNADTPVLVTGLTDNLVYRCTVHANNSMGSGALSAALTVIPGDHGSSTDLAINKTNASSFVGGDLRIGYLITVDNPGPAAVVGARVSDQLEAYFSDPQWTCSGSGGAQCAASGSGDLDTLIDLPVGSSVQIQLSALLEPLPEDPVFNLAAVSVPATMSDPDSSNNVATDGPDVRGVFRDGFE